MKHKIILGHAKMSDAAFEIYTLAIEAAMTGNPYFPTPTPTLAELRTATQAYADGLSGAKTKDAVKIIIKNDLRKALDNLLTNLAYYVSLTANGDRAILTSSGFKLNSLVKSSGQLGAISNFAVKLGDYPGEVIVSMDTVPNAMLYSFYYREASSTGDAWMHVNKSSPYVVISGLERLKDFSFKGGASGTKDQVAYTEVITKTVV